MSVNPNYFYPATYQNPYMYYQPTQAITQQSGQTAQPITLPVVHSDLTVVESMDVVKQTPVGVGQTMGFILRDESVIVHKTGTQNGATYEYWDKRAAEPTDEDKYVTKEYLKEVMTAFMAKKENPDVVS